MRVSAKRKALNAVDRTSTAATSHRKRFTLIVYPASRRPPKKRNIRLKVRRDQPGLDWPGSTEYGRTRQRHGWFNPTTRAVRTTRPRVWFFLIIRW